jgi:hypothetical protein
MNRQGEALEAFVKDAFSGMLSENDDIKRDKRFSEVFSYLGNQNNPPDFMIRGGDAVEVKKVIGASGGLQLNSSYPKAKLLAGSAKISRACRDAEAWVEKDILYVVGQVPDGKLHALWMVYGECYAASADVYEKVQNSITKSVESSGLQLESTNELAKIKKVDPLGITDLRVRGMWGIDSPWRVFKNYVTENTGNSSRVIAIMTKSKFDSMPKDSILRVKKMSEQGIKIINTELPNPDNPAKLIPSVIIDWIGSN